MSVSSRPSLRHHVTVVLVAHDGQTWLPRTLRDLAAQDHQPDEVLAVDTGSTDGSYEVLADALGNSRVIAAEHATTFGQAVALAARTLNHVAGTTTEDQPTEWLWLLHDDSAPASDALRRLLERADNARDVAIVGPKVRDWDHREYLVEVGLSTDGAGHRHTGLERRELDQGQHDGAVDVLAVGSAGALIRRDVWETLRGYDEALPMFRDDLDFGWRANLAGMRVVVAPRAVLYHAQAGATGRRPLAVTDAPPRRLDRTHALFTVLANASWLGVLIGFPRLAIVTVIRAMLFLITRRPAAAGDELLAYLGLLAHPVRLVRARRRRRRTRRVARRSIHHLLPRRGARVRSYIDQMLEWVSGHAHLDAPGAAVLRPHARPDDDDDLPERTHGVLRRVVGAPAVLLVLGLTALSVATYHSLLGMHGALSGGRLLPPPGGASDVWRAVAADWHSQGAGVSGASSPYLVLLGVLSTLLFGKVWLAVLALLVGAMPLAGLTAYRGAKRLTHSRGLRVWAGVAYAVSPPLTSAVAAGRIDALLAIIWLPVAIGSVARALTPRAEVRRIWVAALAVSIVVAATPILYGVLAAGAALLLVGGLLGALARQWRAPVGTVVRALVLCAVPIAVLAPWSVTALAHPALALRGAGPSASDASLGTDRLLALLAGHVTGGGAPPTWTYAPVLVAAVAALAVEARRRFIGGMWWTALAALALTVVATRWHAHVGLAAPVWVGAPVAAIVALLIAATVRGADGSRQRFARRSFSWQQPALVLLVLAAAVTPLAAAGWTAANPHVQLARVSPTALPEYVTDAIGGPTGVRGLLLDPQASGDVRYTVLESPEHTLLDADVPLPTARQDELTGLVRALVSGPSDATGYLTGYAIGYVVQLHADPAVTAALDAQAGIARQPQSGNVAVWTVTPTPARISVLSPAQAALAQAPVPPQPGRLGPVTAVAAPYSVPTTLAAGDDGRLLVLAENASAGWRASLDGRLLTATTAFGGQQAFVVPAAGGTLLVHYVAPDRTIGRLLALVALTIVLVLAAPPVRLRADLPDPQDEPLDGDVEPDGAATGAASRTAARHARVGERA